MDRDFPTSSRWALALISAAMYTSVTSAAGPTVPFQIPAGNAPQTLREFYLQSQVRVLYLADTVKGVQTQAISGKLEASEALAQMLRGTGLSYEFEDEYSAVITRAEDVTDTTLASGTPSSSGEGPSVPAADGSSQRKIEEILVTGSYIHGVFDITSPLIPVEREEMKKTAYATVQDAVWALPMAASLTQSETFGSDGNINRGTGIDLRGLGYSRTLVLVNGRRQPPAGIHADFVDVSNIPWSMVESIEVLPDGSSALYGSDAIAGVVNILLRQEMEGTETQLRYGMAHGGGAELLVAQLLGHRWDTGQWFGGYQYSERQALPAAERDYVANADKRSWGGRDFRSAANNPGTILHPQTLQPAFAIPRGQDGTSLSPGDLLPGVANYRSTFADADLLPDKRMHSVYFTASQNVSESIEAFVEGRYGQRTLTLRPMWSAEAAPLLRVPSTNPFFVDPFGDSPFVFVAYDLTKDFGRYTERGRTSNYLGTFGLSGEFSGSWRTSLSASYGAEDLRWGVSGNYNPYALDAALADSNPTTAFNPFGDGSRTNPATIQSVGAIGEERAQSGISSVQFMADGHVLDLPSGVAKAAIGGEYRRESLNRESEFTGFIANQDRFDRTIAAFFAELSLPLIGHATDSYAPPRLELSLAGRYERYDDFGRTFNPKIGLRWTPLASLKVRASWGTSFKAPSLVDLAEDRSGGGLVSLRDPRSPTGRSNVLVLQGSNPDLREESATTWTAGFDFAPLALPGLQLSLTGYSIEYRDQVIQPGLLSPFDILLHEDEWAAVITRDPSQAHIEAICGAASFFGDPSQCSSTPPTVLLDARKHNLAITSVNGIDLTLSKSFDTDFGRVDFKLNGTQVLHFKRALTRQAPVVDIVDTINSPLAVRLRGTMEWFQRGTHQYGFGAYLTVNHTGGYRDRDSPVRQSVDAWTTFDFGLSYRTDKRGTWTDNTELTLNATNILNEDPPFVDRELGYDVTNIQPTGRVISAFLSKSW